MHPSNRINSNNNNNNNAPKEKHLKHSQLQNVLDMVITVSIRFFSLFTKKKKKITIKIIQILIIKYIHKLLIHHRTLVQWTNNSLAMQIKFKLYHILKHSAIIIIKLLHYQQIVTKHEKNAILSFFFVFIQTFHQKSMIKQNISKNLILISNSLKDAIKNECIVSLLLPLNN